MKTQSQFSLVFLFLTNIVLAAENPSCKSGFTQEALELGTNAAREHFQLRTMMAQNSRNQFTSANRLKADSLKYYFPQYYGAQAVEHAMDKEAKPANRAAGAALMTAMMVGGPVLAGMKAIVNSNAALIVGRARVLGMEEFPRQVDALKIRDNQLVNFKPLLENTEAIRVTPPDASPFHVKIAEQLSEIGKLIALDLALGDLAMHYQFGETAGRTSPDGNESKINQQQVAAKVLQKRSDINYAIGTRYHKLAQFIRTTGKCTRDAAIQEKTRENSEVPPIFYPDADDEVAF